MTTPTGTISLQDVQNEFGGSHPIYLSGDYKGETSDGVNPTALSELQGLSAVTEVNLTISSNTTNYDIESAARSAGWDGASPVIVNLTNNANVWGNPAMRTGNFGGWLEEPIHFTNALRVVGNGGNGGNGNATSSGTNGGGGGYGLYIDGSDTIEITNNHTISGGGGGGGGGGGAQYYGADGCSTTYRQGGGGGGGAAYGSGGSGYQNGGGGSLTGGGSGGDGEGLGSAGNGGSGGSWGNNGSGGQSGSGSCTNYSGGSGGTRGYYVYGNASVTWLTTGTRRGRVA